MPAATSHLPAPVHHVFVDFENIQEIDLAVIGGQSVDFTLLLGPRQTKLDVSLVEKLLEHAAAVQLVRLASPGRNALDFTLSYYVGRAVAADPTGSFHVVSKDKGFDPLIEHLQGKHIHAQRHADFTSLPFASSPEPRPAPKPIAAAKPKPASKPKPAPSIADESEARVLEHLRKPSTPRPHSQRRLVNTVTHLIRGTTESDAVALIRALSQAGHLFVEEKGKVTYHLDPR